MQLVNIQCAGLSKALCETRPQHKRKKFLKMLQLFEERVRVM